jgi:hypothetical protein
MNPTQGKNSLSFVNMWKKNDPKINEQVLSIWKDYGITGERADSRIKQLVLVVVDSTGKVVGISTADKSEYKPLSSYFYAIRCMILPQFRVPGLDSKLILMTRDFLESIHEQDLPNIAAGLIAFIENEKLRERTQAVWPATGMIYMGKLPEGHHIRVYYFKGAHIMN